MRNKLVKRRINKANRDRRPLHRFEDADEIAPLERKKPVQRLHAAKLARLAGVLRRVRVGAHTEAACFIGPFHERFIGLRKLRHCQRKRFGVTDSLAAVKRDPIALANHVAVGRQGKRFVIDV